MRGVSSTFNSRAVNMILRYYRYSNINGKIQSLEKCKYLVTYLCKYLSICCALGTVLPTPVLLPGKSHGWRSVVGCSPWRREESDTTEQLQFHFYFSLSCIGEGNGNPLLCSCLENPRDGGAWWAAVYGVAQNRT